MDDLGMPSLWALTQAESTGSLSQTIRSRYLIAIEDPFEISHNVARTVNQQGRFEIRGEFIRAAKMLNVVNGRVQWLWDLCSERILPEKPIQKRLEVNGQTKEEAVDGDGEKSGDEDGKVRVVIPLMAVEEVSVEGKTETDLIEL
jgi:hypothetical protein